jgi:pimeloyl-ACP methyl ester carboxylesterase
LSKVLSISNSHEGTNAARDMFWRQRYPIADVLDETAGFGGMGRSTTFPFTQWRARDEFETVYFDEGSGRTLVFVHGLGGNATHWEHVARNLADDYRVVGLDMVGCGWTRKPEREYTVEFLRDHLLDFLDQRGLEKVTLVGHSLGGAVCLSAALERPGQIESLVLVGAAGVAPLPKWMRMAAPVFLKDRLLYATLIVSANFIVNNIFVDNAKENKYVNWFRQSAMRDAKGYPNLKDFTRVCETLCRDVVNKSYADRFHHLHMPVLALWGDTDKLTAASPVLRNLDGIRSLRSVVLRRCGHLPMVERPAESIFHLRRFLETPPEAS